MSARSGLRLLRGCLLYYRYNDRSGRGFPDKMSETLAHPGSLANRVLVFLLIVPHSDWMRQDVFYYMFQVVYSRSTSCQGRFQRYPYNLADPHDESWHLLVRGWLQARIHK